MKAQPLTVKEQFILHKLNALTLRGDVWDEAAGW